MDRLLAKGAHMHIPRDDLNYAIRVGLRILILRRSLELKDGMYHFKSDAKELIQYYANAISHLRWLNIDFALQPSDRMQPHRYKRRG